MCDLDKRRKGLEEIAIEVVVDGKIKRDIEIVLRTPKFSSTKEPTLWIKHKEEFIQKSNKITYKCSKCGESNTIGIKRFLSKNNTVCYSCKESSESKKAKQSDYIKSCYEKYGKVKPKKNKIKLKDMSSNEFIKYSEDSFLKEDLNFKKNYFEKNINLEDFEKFKNSIHSVKGFILKSYEDITFLPYIKVNHNIKYITGIYIREIDKVLNLTDIIYKCVNCGDNFKATRRIKEKLSNSKIYCKRCVLCNETFKIKYTNNILGEIISYQSQLELDFIIYCKNNSIVVKDGLVVEYYHNNKNKKYYIDFYLPSIDKHIELKDEHIWFKKNLLNGKHSAKLDSVKDLNYQLVLKKDYNKFLKSLNYQDIV